MEKTENELLHLGIEFARTLKTDSEAYLSGAAFGYSCGYQTASQFKHPVPANKSIADLNHIVINACMNLYAITEKHDEIDKIINAVKSFTNAHPVPASQPAVPQQPVDLDDENFPTYEQIGGGKDWDEMTELENAYYKIGKLKTALTVSKNTINRHKKHPVPDEAGEVWVWVKASERLPNRDGKYICKKKPVSNEDIYVNEVFFAGGVFKTGQEVIEWLSLHPSQPEGDGKSTDWHLGNIARVKEMAEIQSNLNDFKEECERLAGLVKFWQDKYYEAVPNIMPGKIDNNPIA